MSNTKVSAAQKNMQTGCGCMLVLVIALVVYVVVNTKPSSSSDAPQSTLTAQEAVDKAASGIDILAGGRKVDGVTLTGAVLSVEYRTTESEQSKFVDEWIDMYDAVGAALASYESPVKLVELRAYSATGVYVGAIRATLSDIQLKRTGKMSEREFIETLITTTP